MTGHWQSSTKAPAGVWVRIPSEASSTCIQRQWGCPGTSLGWYQEQFNLCFIKSFTFQPFLLPFHQVYFLFLNDLSQAGSREACGEQRTPISGTASCSGWRRDGFLFPFHEGVRFPPLFLPFYTRLSIRTAFFLISMVPFCTPLLSKDKRFSMYPA